MLSECLILPSGFTAGKFRLCNYKILLKLNSEVFLCSELAQGFSVVSVKLNFATLKMRCGSQGFDAFSRRRMRRRERGIGLGREVEGNPWEIGLDLPIVNGRMGEDGVEQCLKLFPPAVTNPSVMIPPLATVTASLSAELWHKQNRHQTQDHAHDLPDFVPGSRMKLAMQSTASSKG